MGKIYINLEKEVFKGNVLDITYDNNSVIYNCNKYYDSFVEIGYLENNLKEKKENLNYYDTCVIFFSLTKIKSFDKKRELISHIYSLTKPGAYLYIWDLDKKPFSNFSGIVQISMPDKTIANMKLNDLNIMPQHGREEIKRAMEGYFHVEKEIKSKDVFKLICRREEEQIHESFTSSS